MVCQAWTVSKCESARLVFVIQSPIKTYVYPAYGVASLGKVAVEVMLQLYLFDFYTRILGLSPILAGLALLASLAPQTRNAWRSVQQETLFQNFTVLDNYRANWPSEYWIRLDAFSQLPDDLVIATTEVGYPGVLNPDKIIVDLAGLNDIEFARNGFSSLTLFSRYQPDLFLLPRSHYAELRRDISGSRTFRLGYEFFQPDPGLGIALRRDSRHYHAMRQVLGLQ